MKKQNLSFYDLRKEILKGKFQTPYDTLQLSIQDVSSSYKQLKTNIKKRVNKKIYIA